MRAEDSLTERPETGRGPRRPRHAAGSGSRIDWNRLFDRDSTEAAMEEIALVLGGPAVEPASVAEPVPGEAAERTELTREAMAAWRVARESLSRMEANLEARSRELGLLQVMGQKAAEARNAEELFSLAAEVLQEASDLEMILVTHRLRGKAGSRAFLSRPVGEAVLAELGRESIRFLQWEEEADRSCTGEPLGTFDPDRWPLKSYREQDLVMLPVMRRGTPAACLALLHSSPPDEPRLRVLYSAANQLSMHIDRILTVQEAEESRFRSILDSMPQAVLLTDTSLRVLQANPAAERLQERMGISGPGETMRTVGGLDLETLAGRVRSGAEEKACSETRLDGGEILDVTVCPFRSAKGVTEGLLLILSDVTESRRLQEQLTHAEKVSSIGRMISGVAHELNNPLASIMGYAQLLRSTSGDSKLSERLGVLYQESRRCQRIVQKLLSFVRNHEPERRALSINEITDSVIGLMKYQLRVDGVEVETDLDLSVPPVVGDGHQLQQALLNLVTNAQHAMRDSTGKGRLLIRTGCAGGDRVRLEVEDSGPGVPEEIRGRIFDPFFTTKGPGEGTGLGLSLVFGTVRAHRGTVRVRDGSLGGACFEIELPGGDLPGGVEEEPADGAESHEVEPARILVVDDETSLVSLLRDALAPDGHEILSSTSGSDALATLEDAGVDLVIMDYRMPDMDGRRLHDAILERHPALAPGLILTTGDTVSREPDKFARQVGMPLLHKPFDLDDLRKVVRRRLRDAGKAGS
jgi:PAS domain S-box-containing protein